MTQALALGWYQGRGEVEDRETETEGRQRQAGHALLTMPALSSWGVTPGDRHCHCNEFPLQAEGPQLVTSIQYKYYE